MNAGWPISLILHMAMASYGYIAFSNMKGLEEDTRIIPVSMVSIDELTNIRASIAGPKEQALPEDEPMQVLEAIDNAPEQSDTPSERVTPEAAPEITASDAPSDETLTVTEPEKVAEFNLDNIAALVDRTKDAQVQANQQQAQIAQSERLNITDTNQQGVGAGTALTINERDALRAAMYKCWRVPIDAENPEELIVRVRVKLLRNGQVESVTLLDEGQIAISRNPYMRLAAERALSAVSKCAPYDFLPADKYDSWRDMSLRFKPEL